MGVDRDWETQRVVVDVRDCVNAYYKLMQTDQSSGQVFNVCGSDLHKMGYFTDKLIELSGLEITKEINPDYYRPIDIQVQIGDTSKLRSITDWSPSIPLEKTLEDLLDYWVKKIGSRNQNV